MSGADRRRQPLERIYGPLGDHLAARAAAGARRVALAFGEVEALLGRPLPPTARHRHGHRAWWAGAGARYPHGWHGWASRGWHVEAVDLAAETVTFVRSGGEGGDG